MWDILGAISASVSGASGLIKGVQVHNTNVSGTTHSVTFTPGTVTGDLVLILFSSSANTSLTTGTGWTYLGASETTFTDVTSGISRIQAWWKKLDGTGDAPTFTKSQNRVHIVQAITFRNTVNDVVIANRWRDSNTFVRGLPLDWAEFTGDRVWLRCTSAIWNSTTNRVVSTWPAGYDNFSEVLGSRLGPQQALCWVENDGASPTTLSKVFTGGSADLCGLMIGVGNRVLPTGPYIHQTRARSANTTALRIFNPIGTVNGDLIINFVSSERTLALSDTTGWNIVPQPTFVSPLRTRVLWKVIDGTDNQPLVTIGTSDEIRIYTLQIKNATVVEHASASATSGTITAPTLTPGTITGAKLWFNYSHTQETRFLDATALPASPWAICAQHHDPFGIAYVRDSDASKTPSNWGMSSSGAWNAYTLGVGNA